MKLIFQLLVIFISLLLLNYYSFACVGARPLGMGGAFVAVADDINCVYWNPAGLAEQKRTVFTGTIDDEKNKTGNYKSSYPYYFAAGAMINDNYWAISYVDVADLADNGGRGKSWLFAATGREIADSLSVGIKFGYREVADPSFDFSTPPSEYYKHLPIILDFGFLYKITDRIKLGALLQGGNNFRPGLSLRPFDELIISYEEYDIFDATDKKGSHYGVEYKVFGVLSLRTGWYYSRTYGFGLTLGGISFDFFTWGSSSDPENMFLHGFSMTYLL